MLPLSYLHGLSSGDFVPAPGEDARPVPPASARRPRGFPGQLGRVADETPAPAGKGADWGAAAASSNRRILTKPRTDPARVTGLLRALFVLTHCP